MKTIVNADLIELVARCGQGDRKAFTQLYETTSPKLYGVALRMLVRRDLAEEVLQEAYVSIWHHAANYRPDKAAVMTWLTTIVRNRCLDVLRVHPHEVNLEDSDTFDTWASSDLTPLEVATQNSQARALINCMHLLQPMQRQAIALSYFYGLAHEQLSSHLEQPLGTIKTWIRRGLQSLKGCMGANG